VVEVAVSVLILLAAQQREVREEQQLLELLVAQGVVAVRMLVLALVVLQQ
jgi:multisubunit Na+/H+ antiporter MnhB subunit